MSDQEVIDQGIKRAGGGIIDDLTARVIASSWHGGQASALYALASSGAIVPQAEAELRAEDIDSTRELAALLAYVTEKGPRGPQAGWSDLHW